MSKPVSTDRLTLAPEILHQVLETVRGYWGYNELRPLQDEAIAASLAHRDAVVVLPTGGGKSLCYQVPPAVAGRTDIVVSPLISLMKDQVDALHACGYPATALHSGMTPGERDEAQRFLASGDCRLALVSPERLVKPGFLELVRRLSIRAFAVDEAHCISHWGHAFRPEYRQLRVIKEYFPDASIHAFTATATERVRADIAAQLQLASPAVLVGRFDRPNLVYRIVPRQNLRTQVCEVLDRHRNEAVIIYCISRADTESLANHLRTRSIDAAHYHAGMSARDRRRTQEAFAKEEIQVIVATVAFGMGIDRSDVRCVIHAATPKSIEHYQQETGRAGRDGLEADCVLFHSPADTLRWRSLLERSSQEGSGSGGGMELEAGRRLLEHIRKFCAPGQCRHRTLSEYFGQSYGTARCDACDICLGESDKLEEGTVTAQKVLSCVARVGQRFGIGHVVDVLRGAGSDRILALGHDRLSTHGIMKDTAKNVLTGIVHQLLDQDLLSRSDGEYPVLMLNDASLEVLRDDRQVLFIPWRTKKRSVAKSAGEKHSWEGVDRDLFERLRELRTEIARQRGAPPYVIFSDASLRDMAREKPGDKAEFLEIHGVGEKKLADFGETFMAVITSAADDP